MERERREGGLFRNQSCAEIKGAVTPPLVCALVFVYLLPNCAHLVQGGLAIGPVSDVVVMFLHASKLLAKRIRVLNVEARHFKGGGEDRCGW